jgi:FlaA1/EpsC-like NDP-sugar epimerase
MQFLADITVLCIAFFLAYLPAINARLGDYYLDVVLIQVPFVILIQFSSLFLVGAYSILWRYVSISDVKVFLKAGAISGLILVAVRFLLDHPQFNQWQVPLSVIMIDTVLGFGGLLALRVVRRFVYEMGDKRLSGGRRKPVKRKPALLVGAGRMGATLIKEMNGRADAELEICGLVDDDPRKKGARVGGHKVLGGTRDLPRLVEEINIKQVVIAIDEAKGRDIRRILDICGEVPVKAQIVPSLNEIAHGRISVSRIRDVQIEDLLGREPVELDDENLHEFLTDKTVMVTGAGGSIGSELVRQIITYRPRLIVLVERAEFSLFNIARELAESPEPVPFAALVADVGDEARMRRIFEEHRPQVIFHAAAHKHVPLMESNTGEAVKNNVLATAALGRLAGEYGTGDFVLISTDKAVNPTSVMGASKRVAEIVVQDLDQTYSTNFIAVRFGNVLGSAGSVVPIFREQIEKGRPITVTDREMTRYFMTIPEAAQLVLQAGALGRGGEIFILDMGEPVKIVNLAEDMIRLSGLTPYEDIDIVFTGARKGEKLFEELEISGETLEKTRHPKIFIGKIATYSSDQVSRMLRDFRTAVDRNDEGGMRMLFNQLLPEAAIEVPPQPYEHLADADPYFPHSTELGLVEK